MGAEEAAGTGAGVAVAAGGEATGEVPVEEEAKAEAAGGGGETAGGGGGHPGEGGRGGGPDEVIVGEVRRRGHTRPRPEGRLLVWRQGRCRALFVLRRAMRVRFLKGSMRWRGRGGGGFRLCNRS